MTVDKTCFFIAPIGEDASEIRKRSDKILKYVVEPPAKECGYRVVRADLIEKPGIITSQVIQHILESDLVVADLTGRNPNVFYELALRHAIRRPYVQLIEMGEIIPFDVAGVRTISVDHKDLDSVEKCKKDIAGQIRALESTPGEVESPVTAAIEIQSLRNSGNVVEKNLAEIREILVQLAAKTDESAATLQGVFQNLILPASEYSGLYGGLAFTDPNVMYTNPTLSNVVTQNRPPGAFRLATRVVRGGVDAVVAGREPANKGETSRSEAESNQTDSKEHSGK